jgi:hypothetical protein
LPLCWNHQASAFVQQTQQISNSISSNEANNWGRKTSHSLDKPQSKEPIEEKKKEKQNEKTFLTFLGTYQFNKDFTEMLPGRPVSHFLFQFRQQTNVNGKDFLNVQKEFLCFV